MSTLYKIRRKSDGLFCRGGEYCHFGKTGKLWTAKALKSHIEGHRGCEVVEYKVTEVGTNSVRHWVKERNADWERRSNREKKQIEREQLRLFGEKF